MSPVQELSPEAVQLLADRRRTGTGPSPPHFLQLPGQLLHLGHGHAQLLLLFVEQGSDRVQVGG